MPNQQFLTILTDLGLTESESKVYLTSLSLGPTTVLAIARAAEIRRTTVYSIIESLKKKGLMHIEPRGFKQLYVAENPERLEHILDTKRNTLQKLLPQFAALYNLKGGESTIKYYEGLAAIKSLYDTVLPPMKPGDDYLIISNIGGFIGMDDYFEKFLEKRIKSRVGARLALIDSPTARRFKKYEKNMNHEVRLLSKEMELSVDVIITDLRVIITSLDQPITAINIENSAMIKMHKEVFEILWASLEK